MATHSSTFAWKIPLTEEPGRLPSMGLLGVGHHRATTLLSLPTFRHWRGNGNPLQCSSLENPGDGGAWQAAVHGVAKSRMTERLHFHALEKEMATHSSALSGESQGRGSLVGCRLWRRTELDTTEVTQQQQQQHMLPQDCFHASNPVLDSTQL